MRAEKCDCDVIHEDVLNIVLDKMPAEESLDRVNLLLVNI